jgi:hypothetical protein
VVSLIKIQSCNHPLFDNRLDSIERVVKDESNLREQCVCSCLLADEISQLNRCLLIARSPWHNGEKSRDTSAYIVAQHDIQLFRLHKMHNYLLYMTVLMQAVYVLAHHPKPPKQFNHISNTTGIGTPCGLWVFFYKGFTMVSWASFTVPTASTASAPQQDKIWHVSLSCQLTLHCSCLGTYEHATCSHVQHNGNCDSAGCPYSQSLAQADKKNTQVCAISY